MRFAASCTANTIGEIHYLCLGRDKREILQFCSIPPPFYHSLSLCVFENELALRSRLRDRKCFSPTSTCQFSPSDRRVNEECFSLWPEQIRSMFSIDCLSSFKCFSVLDNVNFVFYFFAQTNKQLELYETHIARSTTVITPRWRGETEK